MTFQGSADAEGDVHNALIRVLNAVEKKIYYLEGHGELSPDPQAELNISILDSLLSDSGFDTESINLSIAGSVPEDASAIILLDQLAPLQDIEITAISEYLAAGGSMMFARDWHFISDQRLFAEEDGMRAYMTDAWGVQIRPDAILDPPNQLASVQIPVGFAVTNFGSSSIVNESLESAGIIMFTARSLGTQPIDGITHTSIAQNK